MKRLERCVKDYRIWFLGAYALAIDQNCKERSQTSTLAHGFEPAHLALWTSALLGLVVGRAGFGTWSLPTAWRLALGAWAVDSGGNLPISEESAAKK